MIAVGNPGRCAVRGLPSGIRGRHHPRRTGHRQLFDAARGSVGATGTGLASVAFAALADDFLIGVFFRFVAGAFMAGVYVPGMRFLSEWYPEGSRGERVHQRGYRLPWLAVASRVDCASVGLQRTADS